MNLKIKSFKISNDAYINDFVVVKSSPEALASISNPEQINPAAATVHEIVLDLDGDPVTILKNNPENKLDISFKGKQYSSLTEIFTQLGESWNPELLQQSFVDISATQIADQSQFASYIASLVSIDGSEVGKRELNGLLDVEIAKASEETKRDLERFQDLTAKIYGAESKVDVYNNYQRNAKELKEKRDMILIEKERLTQVLSSSKDLIESKTRLEGEIQTVLEGADPVQLAKKAKSVKENRMKKLSTYMQDTSNSHTFDPEEKERNLMIPKTFILILLLQSLFSILIFLLSGDIIAFMYLVLTWVVAIGGGILFQIHGYDPSVRLLTSEEQDARLKGTQVKKFSIQNDQSEEKDLIKYAWVEALNKDLEGVVGSLNQRLGNMTYDELQQKLVRLDSEVSTLDVELKKLDEGKMDQDDYYKYRRELDIFSIERENLLVNLEGKVDNGLIENIKYSISRISDAKKSSDKKQIKLPFIIFNLKEKINWIKEIPLQNNTQVLFFE
jgi:hypothetical protein